MPYDPSLPADDTDAVAAEMRAQFVGIVDLIQTIPQGPQGVPGPAGASVSGAVVDGVSTLNTGEPATASAAFDGTNVRFSFGLPRGLDGTPGAVGPAFTNFTVESVTTVGPFVPATVTAYYDGVSVRLAFGIPQGQNGLQGNNGNDGTPGWQGEQGPPGEVTAAQLASAISGTAVNPNLTNLALTLSDPPTLGEVQQILDKLNELMDALRRPV